MFGVLVPAAVLGYVLSRYVNRILNPNRQRWTAITVSMIGAVVLHHPTDGSAMSESTARAGVKSAVRTVELLEFLAARQDRPARIRDISEALDMPRSSAHALLRTLMAQGWVRAQDTGPDETGTQYGIGIRALLVGTSYPRRGSVPADDHAVPRRPARRLG